MYDFDEQNLLNRFHVGVLLATEIHQNSPAIAININVSAVTEQHLGHFEGEGLVLEVVAVFVEAREAVSEW